MSKEKSAVQCGHAKGFRCSQCWPEGKANNSPTHWPRAAKTVRQMEEERELAQTSEFAFDLTLKAAVRIRARNEDQAREKIQQILDAADITIGPITGEVSWDGNGMHRFDQET